MKVAKRETAVLIRLSEREKRTLKRKAANYGMTVSEYARTLLIHSDDVTIKVIDTEPLKKTAHELAKQGTNLNQFMKFLNTYGVKVFDAGEAQRVLAREVETFMEGEKPIYEPKDFHVIDEIKDPRELAEELREALNPSTTIDEKISFLEEIAAQNGGQL